MEQNRNLNQMLLEQTRMLDDIYRRYSLLEYQYNQLQRDNQGLNQAFLDLQNQHQMLIRDMAFMNEANEFLRGRLFELQEQIHAPLVEIQETGEPALPVMRSPHYSDE